MRESLFQFLFSSSVNWISQGVLFAIAVAACVAYYHPAIRHRRASFFIRLAVCGGVFRLVFAAAKTGLQYWGWAQSEFTKFLLPPYQHITVLLQYAWTHFWLNALLSTGLALVFFVVLRALRAHNTRYFEDGEVELGALMALLAGWPQVVVFIPAVFFSVVIVSIVRGFWVREAYTTLGLPFFIGYATSLILTMYIVVLFDLSALLI